METVSIRGYVSGLPLTINCRMEDGWYYCVKCGVGFQSTDMILHHSAGPCESVTVKPGKVLRLPGRITRPAPGRRTRVYIAGPITGSGNLLCNLGHAIRAFGMLLNRGYAPYLPHLTCFAEITLAAMEEKFSYEDWLALDEEYLTACDAVLRLEGESNGAEREVALARKLGITVYYSVDTLFSGTNPVRSIDSVGGQSVSEDGPLVPRSQEP